MSRAATRAADRTTSPAPRAPRPAGPRSAARVHRTPPPPAVGELAGFVDGAPLVTFAGAPAPVPARTIVPLSEDQLGRGVVLLFENGDAARPIVMGVVLAGPAPRGAPAEPETLTLSASREVTIRCGAATLTLTRAGKVILRGNYILSRSTGANRIKGGSVQIN